MSNRKSDLWVELEPEGGDATYGGTRLPATYAMEVPNGVLIRHRTTMVFVPEVRINTIARPPQIVAARAPMAPKLLADMMGHAENVLAAAAKCRAHVYSEKNVMELVATIEGLAGAVRRCEG